MICSTCGQSINNKLTYKSRLTIFNKTLYYHDDCYTWLICYMSYYGNISIRRYGKSHINNILVDARKKLIEEYKTGNDIHET